MCVCMSKIVSGNEFIIGLCDVVISSPMLYFEKCLFTCVVRLSQIRLTFCCSNEYVCASVCVFVCWLVNNEPFRMQWHSMFVYQKSSSKQTMTVTNERIVSSSVFFHPFSHYFSWLIWFEATTTTLHPFQKFTPNFRPAFDE